MKPTESQLIIGSDISTACAAGIFRCSWGWCIRKPVITGYYEDVNHTERGKGWDCVHGNHGDDVLGCTLSPL